MTAATTANVAPIQSVRLESGMTPPFSCFFLPTRLGTPEFRPEGERGATVTDLLDFDAQGWAALCAARVYRLAELGLPPEQPRANEGPSARTGRPSGLAARENSRYRAGEPIWPGGGFLLRNVTDYLLNRFDDLRNWRRGYGHFWKAGEGIAVFILVGILLTLGIFAAMAATGSDTESAYVPSTPSTEVVTQTIKRKGKTLRVVHHRTSRGDVALRTVTGHGTTVQRPLVTMPARTVRETHTVTTQEIATVTEDQPVTVTVFETVTVKPCKPKSC